MSIPDVIFHSFISHLCRLNIHVAAKPVDRHYIKHTSVSFSSAKGIHRLWLQGLLQLRQL